jgi:hypothetical protein
VPEGRIESRRATSSLRIRTDARESPDEIQRKAKCLDAQKNLADRIAAYRPEAIVSLLIVIKPFVDAAAAMAGSNVPRYAVPFPGMRHQARFQAAMARIIPKLPRLTEPV